MSSSGERRILNSVCPLMASLFIKCNPSSNSIPICFQDRCVEPLSGQTFIRIGWSLTKSTEPGHCRDRSNAGLPSSNSRGASGPNSAELSAAISSSENCQTKEHAKQFNELPTARNVLRCQSHGACFRIRSHSGNIQHTPGYLRRPGEQPQSLRSSRGVPARHVFCGHRRHSSSS